MAELQETSTEYTRDTVELTIDNPELDFNTARLAVSRVLLMVSFPDHAIASESDRYPFDIGWLLSVLHQCATIQPYPDCPKKETLMIAARQQADLHSSKAPYPFWNTLFE